MTKVILIKQLLSKSGRQPTLFVNQIDDSSQVEPISVEVEASDNQDMKNKTMEKKGSINAMQKRAINLLIIGWTDQETTKKVCVSHFRQELFLFVANSNWPAANNLAARSLRPAVIARKIYAPPVHAVGICSPLNVYPEQSRGTQR